MKKFFAVVLALVIVCAAIPHHAYAASTSDRDAALEMACQLFPERASVLRNEKTATNRQSTRTQGISKVYEETRKYSDNLAVTYTEFSDGTAFFSTSDFTPTYVMTDSEFTGTYLTRYTISFTVYSNYNSSQKLKIDGLEMIIDSISYDNITDYGTISSESVSHSFINAGKDWEDSYGPAYASYSADLPDSRGVMLDLAIKVNVGNDRFYLTINDDFVGFQ